MNFLDILMIILAIGSVIGAIVAIVCSVKDHGFSVGLLNTLVIIFFSGVLVISYFLVIDKGSGSTIGTITSVDKNFFGTTSVYVKTSENSQEQYCIENEDIVNLAKKMIGKEVKISYGERVGLYSTNMCHSAPIENIEVIND